MLPQIETQLEQLEDRVTRRMADSVESLGDIIKDYATKYQQLSDRLSKLESKPTKVGSAVVRTTKSNVTSKKATARAQSSAKQSSRSIK